MVGGVRGPRADVESGAGPGVGVEALNRHRRGQPMRRRGPRAERSSGLSLNARARRGAAAVKRARSPGPLQRPCLPAREPEPEGRVPVAHAHAPSRAAPPQGSAFRATVPGRPRPPTRTRARPRPWRSTAVSGARPVGRARWLVGCPLPLPPLPATHPRDAPRTHTHTPRRAAPALAPCRPAADRAHHRRAAQRGPRRAAGVDAKAAHRRCVARAGCATHAAAVPARTVASLCSRRPLPVSHSPRTTPSRPRLLQPLLWAPRARATSWCPLSPSPWMTRTR